MKTVLLTLIVLAVAGLSFNKASGYKPATYTETPVIAKQIQHRETGTDSSSDVDDLMSWKVDIKRPEF